MIVGGHRAEKREVLKASILMIYVSPVRENSMKESHQPED